MIVKPYLSFLKTSTDTALVVTGKNILWNMTGNPNFLAPAPSLAVVRGAVDDFASALVHAADGGKTLTYFKNLKRAALVNVLRELAAYLQVACKGDLTVLIGSGFPYQKPDRQPVGLLPVPKNLRVKPGTQSGAVNASVSAVRGATFYNWQLARAESPRVVVKSGQSTKTRFTFTDLTPGVLYLIQASAVGTAGPSDWSSAVKTAVT
jgi:hypothetical protein